MDNNVIIVGSSGHSKVAIDCFEKEGKYKILGLIDDYRSMGESTLSYKVLGDLSQLPVILKQYPKTGLFVAIGDNWTRFKIKCEIENLCSNIKWVKSIHPSAQLGTDVSIAKGSIVLAGAVINSCSQIGRFCIVNTNSSIDHDNKMNDFSSIAPNVATGGNVSIGKFSAIGIGATIKNNVQIGKHSVIGASSLVLKNVKNNLVVYGIPAKLIRSRNSDENYLN